MRRAARTALLLLSVAGSAHAATYVVTNASLSGPGSFAQAVFDANTNPGHDTITFAIGSGTAVIPGIIVITEDVTIDGRTQPGYAGSPLIVLDGNNFGGGLYVSSGIIGVTEIWALAIRDVAFIPGALTAQSPINLYGSQIGAAGTEANAAPGVALYPGASGSNIGGPSAGQRNVISGNQVGIQLNGILVPTVAVVKDVTIRGNYIGVDATGMFDLPNDFHGIEMFGSERITIGGTAPGAGNLISGNLGFGAILSGSQITVAGNYIGTNAAGVAALPNSEGLYVASSATVIGGASVAARNVISGNRNVGLTTAATDIEVTNNFIGVNAAGTAALPNGQGVIVSQNSADVRIGNAGAGNVISGNGRGILVASAPGAVRIRGNLIGLNAGGTASIPNTNAGISIAGVSSNVTVGGSAVGEGNRIEHNGGHGVEIVAPSTATELDTNVIRNNGGAGVVVQGNTSTSNRIRRNSIDGNTALGIDLADDGVTANDPMDADSDPNGRQNYPQLTSATSGTGTLVAGTLQSVPTSSFEVDFFSSPAPDPSGFGEGATFLGSTPVMTSAAGTAAFLFTSPAAVPVGHVITATATGIQGTSEFSQALEVMPQGTVQFSTASPSVNESAGTITLTVTRSSGVGPATVNYATTDDTAHAGQDFMATSGMLTFADGQASASFTVAILNDAVFETNERFLVTLSAPMGAVLGTPSTVSVEIVNDDVVAGAPTVSAGGLILLIVALAAVATAVLKISAT
ncbi:MAG TPA: Calx-beta domain-containing protein [Thermoanaerobaculia bacterium]|nr:Calx-beta domain-containing protein [Thermoanaerobaculia bacterium]